MLSPVRTCALAFALCSLLCAVPAWANPAQPVDPARLKPFLPPAWKGMERLSADAGPAGLAGKASEAKARYKAMLNGPGRLELVLHVRDEGANAARMYRDYGADYLKRDVREDSQKSLVLGGRRFLLTRSTPTSLGLETLVGDRWMVNLSCIEATEAQCVEAMGHVDLAALEKLKP